MTCARFFYQRGPSLNSLVIPFKTFPAAQQQQNLISLPKHFLCALKSGSRIIQSVSTSEHTVPSASVGPADQNVQTLSH